MTSKNQKISMDMTFLTMLQTYPETAKVLKSIILPVSAAWGLRMSRLTLEPAIMALTQRSC